MTNSNDYHLEELRVAQDPSHPAHILPPSLPEGSRILDIGCGAGQTLLTAYGGYGCIGIDIDLQALILGRKWATPIQFCAARAEQLPFSDRSFDAVIARVSLAYTDLPRTLLEMRRVLRPGGLFWAVLHTMGVPLAAARHSGNVKGWLFFAYIMANSLSFHVLQRCFPLRERYESFQTEHSMRRSLDRLGFRDIRWESGRHLIVTARG